MLLLRIYDDDYSYIGKVETYKHLSTIEEISRGVRELRFLAPCLPEYYTLLREEYYIETKDYSYVIKEVNFKSNSFFEVRAAANIEDISANIFRVFDCFDRSLSLAYEYCLRQTPWVVEYHAKINPGVTYQLPNTNALDMIYVIAEDYHQEVWFDTKNQILHVYDSGGMGKDLGAYYSNELKLQELNQQSSTYDFATVLIPIGLDGITIESINNGRDYLENFSYSNKYIQKIWINEDYDVPEKLKAVAEIELDRLAQPKASYKISVSEIGVNVGLGDTIVIVDKIKRIRQKQRVVRIVRNPDRPEEDSLEVSNLQEDFARNFIKERKRIDKEIAYIKETLATLV